MMTALLLLLFSNFGFADEFCDTCLRVQKEVLWLDREEVRVRDLLGRNRQWIATLKPDETSRRIKLTSNLSALTTRSETLLDNMNMKKASLQRMDCTKCQTK